MGNICTAKIVKLQRKNKKMTKEEIENKIQELKQLKINKFLIIDEKTDGFYNGQILVYEKWLNTFSGEKSAKV